MLLKEKKYEAVPVPIPWRKKVVTREEVMTKNALQLMLLKRFSKIKA